MNAGRIEQYGTPQAIYDRPASMFVADFIGSPPMNFLHFHGALEPGSRSVRVNGAEIAVPEIREAMGAGEMVLGVRPEHVRFDDASGLGGRIVDADYMGTTQIVTIATDHGQLKARLPADVRAHSGETVRLGLTPSRLSLFDQRSGRAIRTAATEEVPHG
jgi:multiple sugar transport system ATP-binding protein